MERIENKTLLIVDQSDDNRAALRALLSEELNLLEAASVEEAIELFAGGAEVDMVLQDLVFSGQDGFVLIEYLKERGRLETMPLIVLSADHSDEFVDRAFALGAVDYIRRPYAERVLLRRVLTTLVLYADRQTLIHQIDQRYAVEPEEDRLTGLLSKKAFFERADVYRAEHPEDALCLMAVDLDHFTLYNQFFGRDSGDRYLVYVAENLKRLTRQYGGLAGYGGADSFYYLCPDNPKLFAELEKKIRVELRLHDLEVGYAPKCGLYRIAGPQEPILDISDRANVALDEIRKDYTRILCWYERSMEHESDAFKLIRDVEYGLRNHEFTFYLQPKCNMLNGKLVGAEALVRWIKTDGTMISPGVFVPVLEENGFISKVDSKVWEEVCRWLRFCIDMEFHPVPISINISRADFYNLDVCGTIFGLVEQYELPVELVELEITESSYSMDDEFMLKEINRLRAHGFTILMDDFGSGYSSLNSLKDIDIDIIKVDMRFLKMDLSKNDKGVGILETIVNLAHAMKVPIIVEGVETKEQVDFLTSINCFYAQGYYYSKPIPKRQFEEQLEDEDGIDAGGVRMREVSAMNLLSLKEETGFTDEMINNILGAIAFYEVEGETIRLLRLNEQYYKMMGMADVMTDPEYAIHLRQNIQSEDRDKFFDLFAQADKKGAKGATADIRYLTKSGDTQWVRVRAFPMGLHGSARTYYAALEDVTDFYAVKA